METPINAIAPIYETRHQFAARQKIGLRTVDRWIAEGVIPVRRISSRCIRIPVEKAEEALQVFDIAAEGGDQ